MMIESLAKPLDAVKRAVAPNALQAELDSINAQLPQLEADAEAKRQAVGEAAAAIARGARLTEAKQREIVAAYSEALAEVKVLRTRRRRLQELLRPPSAVRSALVSLPVPKELAAVRAELEAVRAERLALIHRKAAMRSDKPDQAHEARLADLEDSIRTLRIRRAELEPSHNKAIRAALRPLEVEQARKLKAAASEFLAAWEVLAEVASEKPPYTPDVGNGLERIGNISPLPAHQAIDLANRILAGAGE
ncbi:MAG: hypothetical protein JNK30_18370 [Phenylobacterium sp.]|uniref:hypothetical protein n=1 Tax=Phenylobacterium sp. TaxID=1871053 RepID=UPI001A37067B|nr:hypothetical protein [Phenylobacterium sp.]MBL8773355.1 hypothetical protein [Phenylobacterium sp.]